jgi:hypothetical protein
MRYFEDSGGGMPTEPEGYGGGNDDFEPGADTDPGSQGGSDEN